MYNSQYYTCEQIDERLLQGYLDDYNQQNNTNLSKAEFLTLIFNTIGRNSTVDNLVTQVGYYECDTAAGTAAKVLSVASYALFVGGSMKVKFANKNTANNATLNINSQGAKALYYQGEIASATNSWDDNEVVEIYYDGTRYYANNIKGGSGSGVYDVSKEHPTSGPNGDGKFTLEYILNSSNVNELIPVNKREPGMTIQFVSTSDNKYVQYRLMTDSWSTDVADWQGVDMEPTAGSNNLVKSGGVHNELALGAVYDVSAKNPTAGPNNDGKWESLSALLLDSNLNTLIPTAVRKGGMSIKFVQSVDNKYVQYMLIANDWSTAESDWQKQGDYVYFSEQHLDSTQTEKVQQNIGLINQNKNISPLSDIIGRVGSSGAPVSPVMITYRPNPNDRVLFFPIIPGYKYVIHVEEGREGRKWSYANTLLTESPSVDTNIGGKYTSPYENAGTNYTITIPEAENYPYIVVPHKMDTAVTCIETKPGNLDKLRKDFESLNADTRGQNSIVSPVSTIVGLTDTVDGGKGNNYVGIKTVTVYYTQNTNCLVSFYPITAGKRYKIDIPRVRNYTLIWGYASSKLDDSPSVSASFAGLGMKDVFGGNTTLNTVTEVVESAQNYPYIFICYYSSSGNPILTEVTRDDVTEIGVLPTKDLSDSIILPRKLYEIGGVSASFNARNRVYIEGLVDNGYFNQQITNLTIDRKQNVMIHQEGNNAEYSQLATLSADGYKDLNITIPYVVKPKSNAKNKQMRIMCIGDSLTAQGYPSLTEFIFKSINNEIGNVSALMVGEQIENKTVSLGGETYQCRGCNAGRGGRTITDYLRHAFYINISSETTSSIREIGYLVAWATLGLATKTRNGIPGQTAEAYTGTDAQKLAIITTCHGYYDADPCEELWDYLVNICGLSSFTYDGVTYTFGATYSSADNAAQIAAVKFILSDDSLASRRIPFYDYQTVQSSNGQYAFNLSAYLDKYKTLADDGVTRLVAGSTAGTLVTDVNAWDVCTPTHVVIIMTTNNYSTAGVDNASVVADAENIMAQCILSDVPSAKIALGSTRRFGALKPSEYDYCGQIGEFLINIKYTKYDIAVFKQLCELKDNGAPWELLNLYQTQTVIGNTYPLIDTVNCDEKVISVENQGLHTDFYRYIDRAYQVAAWVIANV